MRWTAIVAGALGAVCASAALARGDTTIDDFEGASAPAPWVFSNGAEFPGATGSLTLGVGHTGRGAHLAYDFSAGGNYVAATIALATPAALAAVGLWVRSPAGIRITLRVIDSTGQTFQYALARPFDAIDPTAWYRHVVALDGPSLTYGGAADGVLHAPLTAISVVAGDGLEAGYVGAIDFDEVVVVGTAGVALEVAIDPASQAIVPGPPSSPGDFATRLGVNVHFAADDRALDILHDAGVGFVRGDLGWSAVETTAGSYDFAAVDGLVAALAARQMTYLLILDYGNPLYPATGTAGFATTTVPAFAAMARALAAHLAGTGVRYEIWNEPNGANFWPPTPNPVDYATLCAAAIAAVHAGDASAQVTTGGLSGFDLPFLRAMLAAGGAQGADAVGIHPYRTTGGESITDNLVLVRSIVGTVPIWDTEWGYSSAWYGSGGDPAARATQAKLTARELLSAWAAGLPTLVDYDFRDDGTDPTDDEDNFGLVAIDDSDKPAAAALRTLSQVAAGRRLTGFLDLVPTAAHALVLTGAHDVVVAAWLDAPGSQIAVTVPSGTTGIDELGAPLPIASGGFLLGEADGPVYLTYPVPASDGGDAGAPGADARSSTPSPHAGGGCGCDAAPGAARVVGGGMIGGVVAGIALRRRRRSRKRSRRAARPAC